MRYLKFQSPRPDRLAPRNKLGLDCVRARDKSRLDRSRVKLELLLEGIDEERGARAEQLDPLPGEGFGESTPGRPPTCQLPGPIPKAGGGVERAQASEGLLDRFVQHPAPDRYQFRLILPERNGFDPALDEEPGRGDLGKVVILRSHPEEGHRGLPRSSELLGPAHGCGHLREHEEGPAEEPSLLPGEHDPSVGPGEALRKLPGTGMSPSPIPPLEPRRKLPPPRYGGGRKVRQRARSDPAERLEQVQVLALEPSRGRARNTPRQSCPRPSRHFFERALHDQEIGAPPGRIVSWKPRNRLGKRDPPARIAPVQVAIGRVRLETPLVLAPMAGVTDRDFRLIVRRVGGVGLVTMEFIPSKALVRGVRRTLELMHFAEEERPISIQIYGSDAPTMAEAARQVEALGADACDINMGCPANKVLKGCAGCALMGDLELARSILAACRRAVSIPLTVKFRLGLDEARQNYLELGRVAEGEGLDAVALHTRTARQMFAGSARARWDAIARLKEAVSIPVFGNGDVQEPEDALEMLRQTGCDGVLIGRAATKNPWIFHQAADLLAGRPPRMATLAERRALILEHFRQVAERESSSYALHKLRKFCGWYTHGIPHGRELRQRIQSLPDVPSFLQAVEEFFDRLPLAA